MTVFLSKGMEKRLEKLVEIYWDIKQGDTIRPWMFGKLVLDIQTLQSRVGELEKRLDADIHESDSD